MTERYQVNICLIFVSIIVETIKIEFSIEVYVYYNEYVTE